MVIAERELVVSPGGQAQAESDDAQNTFGELFEDLERLPAETTSQQPQAKLVSPDGQAVIELPPRLYHVLRFVAHHMARGDSISLMPRHKQLSTQQAAEILNVSRPFLIKLLDEGDIRFVKVGAHRRVRLSDVVHYKNRRDQQALNMLEELAKEAQQAGDYFGEE